MIRLLFTDTAQLSNATAESRRRSAAGRRFSLLSGLSGDLYCRILESNNGAKEMLDRMPLQYPNSEISSREDFISRWAALFNPLRMAPEPARHHSPLFNQLWAYIDEHYQESDLSLTKLADLFNAGT